MTNQIQATQPKPYAVTYEVNGEQLQLDELTVFNYLVRGEKEKISPQEVVMFLNLCKFQKLNPFLNEAYLVKFGNTPAQIITSKEAFMKRAEAHPKYEGFEAGVIVERNGEMVEIEGAITLKNDILLGGWCKVYRAGRKHPTTAKISLSEFSKGQATWKQMPLTMIRKSAIVNALREAFPDTVGAMYTEDDAELKPASEMAEINVQREIEQNANTEVLDFVEPEQVEPKPKAKNKPEPTIIDAPPTEQEEFDF